MSDEIDVGHSSRPVDVRVESRDLNAILLQSLNELAAAGRIESACRLAGQACVALRRADPTAARRFDVLLHRLTPKLTW